MHEDHCAVCTWYSRNNYLPGGLCDLHNSVRQDTMTCPQFEQKTTLLDRIIIVGFYLLFGSMVLLTTYFAYFLFWRAGYFS